MSANLLCKLFLPNDVTVSHSEHFFETRACRKVLCMVHNFEAEFSTHIQIAQTLCFYVQLLTEMPIFCFFAANMRKNR